MAKPGGATFQVFISHDTRDYEIASKVFAILERIGANPYMYELFPEYRKDIPLAIRDLLRVCPVCLCFLTYNGIDSQWVHQELGAAYAFNKVIIPIIEAGVEYKGFVQFRPRLPYNLMNWERFAYDIIWAIRQELLGHRARAGLRLKCQKGHENNYLLPSTDDVNSAIEANNVFAFRCQTCSLEIRVSPWTFEEVSI